MRSTDYEKYRASALRRPRPCVNRKTLANRGLRIFRTGLVPFASAQRIPGKAR